MNIILEKLKGKLDYIARPMRCAECGSWAMIQPHYTDRCWKCIQVALTTELIKNSAVFVGTLKETMDWLDIDCGYECGNVHPYGFVPECGCPVHDPDENTKERSNNE